VKPRDISVHVISPGKTFKDTKSPEGKNFQGVGKALPGPIRELGTQMLSGLRGPEDGKNQLDESPNQE
jgi:hypothetical protein